MPLCCVFSAPAPEINFPLAFFYKEDKITPFGPPHYSLNVLIMGANDLRFRRSRKRGDTQLLPSDDLLDRDPRAYPVELMIREGERIAALRENLKTAILNKIGSLFDRYYCASSEVRARMNDTLHEQFGLGFPKSLEKKQATIVLYTHFLRRTDSELNKRRLLTEKNVLQQLREILGGGDFNFDELEEVGMISTIFAGAVEDEDEFIKRRKEEKFQERVKELAPSE